jgi:hypothetical protein
MHIINIRFVLQMPGLKAFCSFCGFDGILKGCSDITQDMQSRTYDHLDVENAAFDRDYLEYSVNISDLKNSLQVISLNRYCELCCSFFIFIFSWRDVWLSSTGSCE